MSAARARVFQCPNCKEYINTSMTECRFCQAPVDAQQATAAVGQLNKESDAADRKDTGKRDMMVGGLLCVGGTLITLVTYGMAVSSPRGGTYVIAWGAIVFGGIRFIRGAFHYLAG